MSSNENLAPETGTTGEFPSGVDGVSSPAKPITAEELFGQGEPAREVCAWNQCGNAHRWPVTIAVSKCPGCGAPVLAVKMENCPYCNEPTTNRSLRLDHVPRGGAVNARCRKVEPWGESLDIALECHHWEHGQASAKLFEEKRANERPKK